MDSSTLRRAWLRGLRMAVLPLLLASGAVTVSAGVRHRRSSYVMPCVGVTLSASYLADAAGSDSGFLFRIDNHTGRPIRLEQPVPSSADWYAQVGNGWLWRASAGRGGALVNAENPRGLMFAYGPAMPPPHPEYVTVPAHGSRQWTETMRANPAIAYDPSCPMCDYPGESTYQAVFAYAYLPNPEESARGLLRCGLRSAPVPMPPHPAAAPSR